LINEALFEPMSALISSAGGVNELSMTPTRLLVLADVGGETTRHIGDEAMLEANLAGLRRIFPAVMFTVVCHDPAWTAARYGVDAVPLFGFRAGRAAAKDRASTLASLQSLAAGGAAQDHPTVKAVWQADGVVVSGGGNLSSTWVELLYERIALLRVAAIFGKPAAVLGQTIGPRLEESERRLLGEALGTARFIGLRELPSAALALELGLGTEYLWYQSDDALAVTDGAALPARNLSGTTSIAVTIDPQIRAAGTKVFDSLIQQLRELAQTTNAVLILIPHAFGGESEGLPSDRTEAEILAERIGLARTVVAAGADTERARQIAAEASLIVSSRYHPIIFGLGAGTPCIGIHGDEYCRIKIEGALAHAHLERWALTYEDVSRGDLLAKALELWRTREEVRRSLSVRHEIWRVEARNRWLAIQRALDPGAVLTPIPPSTMFGRPLSEITPALAAALEARRRAWEREREDFERLALRCDESEARARWMKDQLGPFRTLRRYTGKLLRLLRVR
jgi:polysaccharide pyruvyl transferase WcaK-like protein